MLKKLLPCVLVMLLLAHGAQAQNLFGSTPTPWQTPGTIGSTTPNTGAFTNLTATGSITYSSSGFATGSANTTIFNSGGHGTIFSIGSTAATVTGGLKLLPGIANAPIAFTSINGTSADQGFAYSLFGPNSQFLISVPNTSGAFSNPVANSYNCGGQIGNMVICNNTDTFAAAGVGTPTSFTVTKYFGGAGTTGGRFATNTQLILNAATSDTGTTPFYQAQNIDAEAKAPAGGTVGTPLGSLFADGSYSRIENGATNFVEVSGIERDLSIETGGSAQQMHGNTIVLLAANAVAPSIESTAYAVSAQLGATPTIGTAYAVGRYDGYNPLSSSAYIMRFLPHGGAFAGPSITGGIKLDDFTFSGNAFSSTGFSVSGIGQVKTQSNNVSSTFFTQTAPVTVANTVSETPLTGAGQGTLTVPANFLVAGKTLKLTVMGFHSAAANPTIDVKVKLGSTVVLDTGAVTSGSSTNAFMEIRGLITCATTGVGGTVNAQGFYQETGGGTNNFGMVNTSPVTIDTTASQAMTVTVTWGTASASDTITASNLVLEALN